MHLPILLFASLLAPVSSGGYSLGWWKGMYIMGDYGENLKVFPYYKMMPEIIKYGNAVMIDTGKKSTDEEKYLCQYTYCHNEDKLNCFGMCKTIAKKIDDAILDRYIRGINNSVPAPNQAACNKLCRSLCGKNDCKAECTLLCHVHFSFENRAEYEKEFKQYMMELFYHPESVRKD